MENRQKSLLTPATNNYAKEEKRYENLLMPLLKNIILIY